MASRFINHASSAKNEPSITGLRAGDSGCVSAHNGANIDQDRQDPAVPTGSVIAPTITSGRVGPGLLNSDQAPAGSGPAAPVVRPPPVPISPVAPQASHPPSPLLSSFSKTPFHFNSHASPSIPPLPKDTILHAHRQSHNSSKLPAFRFTDLKESIAQPSLLQRHYRQDKDSEAGRPQKQQRRQNGGSHQPETRPAAVNQSSSTQTSGTETTHNRIIDHKIVLPDPLPEKSVPIRSRTSTSQIPKFSSQTTASTIKRSTSLDAPTTALPTTTAGVRLPPICTETAVNLKRRAPTSPLISLGQETPRAGGLPAEVTPRKRALGQRDLSPSKGLKPRTATNDKRTIVQKKPPLSYIPRAGTNGSGTAARIPPIRSSKSFQSPGERRSLVLDMNVGSERIHDTGDEHSDADHRDITLRALEGNQHEGMQWSFDSGKERPDGEDSGDLFLRIAREDSSQRTTANTGRTYADNPNVISRVARTARRPLSVAISSYQSPSYRSPSPPHMSRRLSEQEAARAKAANQDQGDRSAPPVSYRAHSREPQSDEFKFRGANTPIKASPHTQRTFTFQVPSETTSTRRRQLSIDQAPAGLSRMASLKQGGVNYSHPRAYNSSPLVPQSADAFRQDTQVNDPNIPDGTDSTTSTAAPSTVWDELEELKSRIHRLELTGKLPPTSNAAISRASDERPATAHTNATTLSASPKRGAPSVVQSIEGMPRESHPLLHSALAKSKDFLTPDVYDALEAAIVDALALAAIMGTAGQPGPISSGASTIGSSSGTVTDRHLRKKTDSVCRSLTELCLALSENAVPKHQQLSTPYSEDDTVTDPTITPFTMMAAQRRPSAPANRVEFVTSPRVPARNEEKRVNLVPASPRYSNTNISASADATPATPGRKSSLLFTRSRRGGTEEPEEGRRLTTTMARSRRAATEESEDQLDRKPIITRGRRPTLEESEDESGFRIPSRAITEVNGLRLRDYTSQLPPSSSQKEADKLASSALPRRRLATATSTRLGQPATVTTAASIPTTPSKRYFDRALPSREPAPEAVKVADDRTQRQFSLGRTGSLTRRLTHRASMIAAPSTTTSSYHR